MIDSYERKKKAHELRKNGQYDSALSLYKDLITEGHDEYDLAGYLNCLRKLNRANEASEIAATLSPESTKLTWLKQEVIWSFIQGKVFVAETLNEIISVANIVLSYNPDQVAIKTVASRVVKKAKEEMHWETVHEWMRKIDPTQLSLDPISNTAGKIGWSEQALWYYDVAKSLTKIGQLGEAIKIVDDNVDKFKGQQKYFYRLKAQALKSGGFLEEAEKIYAMLCANSKADWWLLHEYGKILISVGKTDLALNTMLIAAQAAPKPDTAVTLYADIADIFSITNNYHAAKKHIQLATIIRENNDWALPKQILDLAAMASDSNTQCTTYKQILKDCKVIWKDHIEHNKLDTNKPARHNLVGKLILTNSDKPYCFISSDGEEFFCLKKDLCQTAVNVKVVFDAVESYDKKKNRKSWRAVNVRSNEEI